MQNDAGDWLRRPYAAFFGTAFTFAHLARCAAAILFRPAADIVRLGLPFDFCFAQRAFCARLIFLRAAADKVRRVEPLDLALPKATSAAVKRRTSFSALFSSPFK